MTEVMSLAGQPKELIQTPNRPWSGPSSEEDVLSEVLRTIRLSGSLQFSFMVAGSWQASNGPFVNPTGESAIPFHVILDGACWLKMEEQELALAPGDVGHGGQVDLGGLVTELASVDVLPSLLDRGDLGTPVFASIDMRAIPHWMPWQERLGWVTLRIMSIHHLDAFRYLFGDPQRVFASIRPDPLTAKKFAHEDGLCLYILEYAGGFRAASWDDVWAGPALEGAAPDISIRWRVEGTEGLARGTIGWPDYPNPTPSTLDFTTTKQPGYWFQPRWKEVWFPDAFIGTMAQLLCALEERGEPEIGGADNPVVKDAFGRPYIPGSSLRGRLRSLLEQSMGFAVPSELVYLSRRRGQEVRIHQSDRPDDVVCLLFGRNPGRIERVTGDAIDTTSATPARLTVYDAPLDQESITPQMRDNLDDELTEVKSASASGTFCWMIASTWRTTVSPGWRCCAEMVDRPRLRRAKSTPRSARH